MTLTPEQLDGIEERARKATPGPWRKWAPLPFVGNFWIEHLPEGSAAYVEGNDAGGAAIFAVPQNSEADGAHIAGLSPEVVLALTARVRELESLLGDLYGYDWPLGSKERIRIAAALRPR